MKVNTDGVLLGALMTIEPFDKALLDIGTGTGTIALMAAQRIENLTDDVIVIDAIDVDEPSAVEASVNFSNSPWQHYLTAHHFSLSEFADKAGPTYDLIFSNPPYFEDSLVAPDERKSVARHTSEGLSYRDIFEFSSARISSTGRVSLILPANQETMVCRYAGMHGFHLFRIVRIKTVPRKSPSRIVVEFSLKRSAVREEMIVIQDDGVYTPEYLSIMKDFYLFA